MSKTYLIDFNAWTDQTAQLLRAGRWAEIDIEHLIGEIEDLGKRDSPRRGFANPGPSPASSSACCCIYSNGNISPNAAPIAG
ncbi:MAG: DUF29 family protein [Phormidesmis sp.]